MNHLTEMSLEWAHKLGRELGVSKAAMEAIPRVALFQEVCDQLRVEYPIIADEMLFSGLWRDAIRLGYEQGRSFDADGAKARVKIKRAAVTRGFRPGDKVISRLARRDGEAATVVSYDAQHDILFVTAKDDDGEEHQGPSFYFEHKD